MSEPLQITYEERDPRELWRANIYIFRRTPAYFLLFGFVAICTVFFSATNLVPLGELLFLGGTVLLIPFVLSAINIFKASVKPTESKTLITEFGVSDDTEGLNKTYIPWKKVMAIQYEQGHIFFLALNQSIFVPVKAFENEQEAMNFTKQAQKFWAAAKGKNIPHLPAAREGHALKLEDDMKKKIEAYEDDEEAVWKAMEEEHRKNQ